MAFSSLKALSLSIGEFTIEASLNPVKRIMETREDSNKVIGPGTRAVLAGGLFTLVLAAGCASTEVTDQRQFVTGPLPRPGNILVCDFVANPAEVPADSVFAGRDTAPAVPPTAEQLAAGRQAGAEIALQLVEDIRELGMPVHRAPRGTKAQLNDIVIRGYILSVDEGSTIKRVTIGFGSGKSTLKVAVESFQMTSRGLRKLGSSNVNAGGNKVPGSEMGLAALLVTGNPVGLIVGGSVRAYNEVSGNNRVKGRTKQIAREIADQLKIRFQVQCWIN
jgi:hypothetical protein